MSDCKDQAQRWIQQTHIDIKELKKSVKNLDYYFQQLENKREA